MNNMKQVSKLAVQEQQLTQRIKAGNGSAKDYNKLEAIRKDMWKLTFQTEFALW